MFDRILCANDGSERAFRALTLAVAMAKESGETRREIVAFRNWLLKEMSQLNWNRYSESAAKVAS
jgi:hypothetical protein